MLEDRHTIRLGDRMVTAKTILVAVGGRPWKPEIPGIEHAITSDEAFYLEALPKRVAVVGGGFIACEFAGIFKGLGSEVTQIYRGDAVLRGFDSDVRRVVSEGQRRKGIELVLEANVTRISKTDDGLELLLDNGDTVAADEVLYATGRVPNVRGLGLRDAGVEVKASGQIVVDRYSRTNVDNIFAVGSLSIYLFQVIPFHFRFFTTWTMNTFLPPLLSSSLLTPPRSSSFLPSYYTTPPHAVFSVPGGRSFYVPGVTGTLTHT